MFILGINGNFTGGSQDGAAALLKDGEVIAAAEEERFLRSKHAVGRMPLNAIYYCLSMANISIDELDWAAYPASTYKNFDKRLWDYFKFHFGKAPEFKFIEHHVAHASSSFYMSGFKEALIFSVDLSGDSVSTLIAKGRGREIMPIKRFNKPDSLGLFYAMMTQFLGFEKDNDEYKVMGLAAHGEPEYNLNDILSITGDRYYLNPEYISPNFTPGSPSPTKQEASYSDKLIELLGPPRLEGEPLEKRHTDIAASVQEYLESAIITLVNHHTEKSGLRNLCLAGGVALNCSMNGKLRKLPSVDNLFVSPVSSDAGTSLGAAIYSYIKSSNETNITELDNYYLGPEYSEAYITEVLEKLSIEYKYNPDVEYYLAQKLAEGKIIAIFNGRMEYGPRALGNRSILARPDNVRLKDFINAEIKGREWFRPLAPVVLEENFGEIFEADGISPYMTVTFPVRNKWRKHLSGVINVDYTSRPQTVNSIQNYFLYQIIRQFHRFTGTPALLNTSLNTQGRPIVLSPQDAIEVFYSSPIDFLSFGKIIVTKHGSSHEKNIQEASPQNQEH